MWVEWSLYLENGIRHRKMQILELESTVSTEIVRLKGSGWAAKYQISAKNGPHGMKKPQVRGAHSHGFLAIDAIRFCLLTNSISCFVSYMYSEFFLFFLPPSYPYIIS